MRIFSKYLLFFTLWITCLSLKAQNFYIPDYQFKSYLYNSLGSKYFDFHGKLIIDSAAKYTGGIHCPGKNIRDLSGLQFFTNAVSINISNNPLSAPVPDLSGFSTLRSVWAENCGLTTFPNLNQISTLATLSLKNNNLSKVPEIEGLGNLRYLDISMNQIDSLPDINTLVRLENFYAYKNQLVYIPPVNNLQNLLVFDVQRNNLKNIPDLRNNTRLETLICSENDISHFPDLSNNINLKELIAYRNNIAKIPGLSACNKLIKLFVQSNKLTELPDLSGYPFLTYLVVSNNQLSFSSLLPVVNHVNYSGYFVFSPQDTIGSFTTVAAKSHSSTTLSFENDKLVSTNNYKWFKGQILVEETNSYSFTISPVSESDKGYYFCHITNSHPKFDNFSLVARIAKLETGPCFDFTSINYQITSNDCNEGTSIKIADEGINGAKPFSYELIPLNGQVTGQSNGNIIEALNPGKYDLKITDADNCSITFQNYINLSAPSGCEKTFTPNGDGFEDEFYISSPGTTKIYSKEGRLLKELVTPAYWDGTDASGNLVPMGYYLIVTDNKEKTGVVLIN